MHTKIHRHRRFIFKLIKLNLYITIMQKFLFTIPVSPEFDKVEDLREQYQNLTHDSDYIIMYIRNGNGQANDPFLISSATDLYNMRYMYELVYQPYGSRSLINYYFKLINNIVIPTNVDWEPIKVCFTGTLDAGIIILLTRL